MLRKYKRWGLEIGAVQYGTSVRRKISTISERTGPLSVRIQYFSLSCASLETWAVNISSLRQQTKFHFFVPNRNKRTQVWMTELFTAPKVKASDRGSQKDKPSFCDVIMSFYIFGFQVDHICQSFEWPIFCCWYFLLSSWRKEAFFFSLSYDREWYRISLS